jgi:hypothetical protein
MRQGGGVVKTVSKRAFGRSLADFAIEGAITPNSLLPAEELLLECVALGERTRIAATRPEKGTHENTIRGLFLRFLLLGDDENTPVHEKGIFVYGAFIEGLVDLEGTASNTPLHLENCQIAEPIWARFAKLSAIDLSGSAVRSLAFAGARIEGDVLLGYGFEAHQSVDFSHSSIDGQFICDGGTFRSIGRYAIYCENAKFSGSVFLRDGFSAIGEVSFRRAEIGGALGCDGGTFATKTASTRG